MTPPTLDLMFLLGAASHALRARHVAGLAEVGISPREHCVLLHARPGGLTQKEIGQRCGVDKTTMVATLDHLEAAELVRRRSSPTDRRARLVSVTPAGETVLARAQEIARRIEGEVLGTLPAADREAFLATLQRLTRGPLAGGGPCGPVPGGPC